KRQVVLGADPARRRIIVGPRGSGTRTVPLRAVNWLIPQPEALIRCTVKLRAREEPRPATVEGTTVTLDDPALPAPGQACVFYAGSRVLGGGVIARASAPTPP
ncbi:MAG: aminomethyltransferase beta-barrel domain-containing protein, partial [Rhodopila sp.]